MRGKTYKECCDIMNVSKVAIHLHLHAVRAKLSAKNNAQAVFVLLTAP
jgi:DNA-binding CsgD family transcriptional regulator